jgi:membrane fusion protein, macrolide-specific efflux system
MKPVTLFLGFAAACMFLSCNKQAESTSPRRISIEESVFASGYMEQENTYALSANADGILLSLSSKAGLGVENGQRIAVIQNDVQSYQVSDAQVAYEDAAASASPGSPELQSLLVQIEQAKKQLSFDKENYQRFKELYAQKSVSKLEFEKYELQYVAAQNNLKSLEENYNDLQSTLKLNEARSRIQLNTQKGKLNDYYVFTSQPGIITKVLKKEGELVRRGETIAQVASGDFIVKLFVAEDDIVKVNVGQSAALNINTYPNQVFMATVHKIYPGFDEGEQSYIVEAVFDKFPPKMFNGTQLQANIEVGKRENVLIVPSSYLIKGQFVKLESGEEKAVKIGSRTAEWTEIISGLSDKDIIVKP